MDNYLLHNINFCFYELNINDYFIFQKFVKMRYFIVKIFTILVC